MSDLLAPVLCELKNESETFWCFVGLMQRAMFVCTPTDNDIDKNLQYLRELMRLMVPKFYEHLKKQNDAMELLFCHRWILLCFKREFTEAVAIRIWEACWANYLTDYFHLFVCLAIISAYADDVIAQDLHTDEILLHFSSLGNFSRRVSMKFYKNNSFSYVHGRSVDLAESSRFAAPVQAISEDSMYPDEFVSSLRTRHMGFW